MRKTILITLFISIVLVLTLQNVNLKKDSTNVDIKIQAIEALGADESGSNNPCTAPGGLCFTFDEDGNPVYSVGLSIP